MASWLCNHWEFVVEFFISLGVLAVLMKLVSIPLSRPKVIFCEARVGGGYEKDQTFCWYIPVMNERRNSWLRHFCQREDAVDCRIKVRFTTPAGKLIYNYAEWWRGSPISKTLKAGSFCEFPLAFVDSTGDVHLAGTPVSTASSGLPPYRLPFTIDVTASAEVLSKRSVVATSKWLISVNPGCFEPLNVKRVES